MKMVVGSVFDAKVQVWSQPFVMQNKGALTRAWEESCNDPQTQFFKHPTDFSMFIIGEWDDENGQIRMLESKHPIGTAIEFKREQKTMEV